jgi:hypothetical protein
MYFLDIIHILTSRIDELEKYNITLLRRIHELEHKRRSLLFYKR